MGIFFLKEENFSYINKTKEINQNQILVTSPRWSVINKTKNINYEITSSEATHNNSDNIFFLINPVFKTFSNKKLENSISSDEAILESSEEKLVMKKKVDFKLLHDNEILHLYSELVIFDLKNYVVTTKHDVELETDFFSLKGEAFRLKQSSKKENVLTFMKAVLIQRKKGGYEKFGSADIVQITEKTDILVMSGSAEIKLESMNMIADEIRYNYKTRTIINSKNSSLINKS